MFLGGTHPVHMNASLHRVENVANVSVVYSSDRQGCLNAKPCSKRSDGYEDAAWLTVHVQGRGFRGRRDRLLWKARAPSGSILASRMLCRPLQESGFVQNPPR